MSQDIVIPFSSFETIFPLHVVFNDSLVVVSVSEEMQSLCAAINVGIPFKNCFRILQPYLEDFTYEQICAMPDEKYIIQTSNHLKFKANVIVQEKTVVFLCQLFIDDVEDYSALPKMEFGGDLLLCTKALDKKIENFKALEQSLRQKEEVIVEKERALVAEKEQARINKEKLSQNNKEIGFEIQKALLLGRLPKRENLTIEVLNIPSQEVSGDFYDFFNHDTKCMDLVIGDVMGKGIAAALVAAALKGVLLRCAGKANLPTRGFISPQKIMLRLMEEITPELIELETFATMCYNRFNLFTHKLISVDFGHTNILHYKFLSEQVQRIVGKNLPLGVQTQPNLEIAEEHFDDNDIFLFYSDGVIEVQNEKGEMFGEQKLMNILKQNSTKTPGEIIAKVRESLIEYSYQDFKDDVTCIVVKIEEVFSQTRIYNVLMITSCLDELKRVRNYITKTASKIRYFQNEENLNNLLLAANEVVANIIRHGYKNDPDNVIRIEISVSHSWIRICFVDKGIPFSMADEKNMNDIDEITDADLQQMSGGFGLYIIHSLVDKVTYHRDSKGNNYLSLIKNFQSETLRTASSDLDIT
ncbi:SpoIIE family protein phosphatase [Candidatus Uabimicrobium amorphum]|uniref:guanylate cyclase n=1 Tax=Uabimicrobium amorphum TaxID=2596890 RepID=A0A5S9IRP4_UABAM|nr:SpoIIE family protein phosphatase [Candidatus Uabimicrobium amorphum]BBM86898.1 serine phosphatase [Candidatus Uabimicrobium amorphum]